LSDNEKAQILWDKGVFLMNRDENGLLINLYALFDFYAEAYYDSKTNEIKRFRTFKTLNPLQPYLDRIYL